MKPLVRIHRESLRTLILEFIDLKSLGFGSSILDYLENGFTSLILPTKVRVLTPPWIISFRVWRVEGLHLVIKSISLLYLDCSLDLRKVGAVNS